MGDEEIIHDDFTMNYAPTNILKAAVLTLALCLIVLPRPAAAATAFLTADYAAVAVGDTIVVSVAMDTAGRKPNTVEGDILIRSGAGNITVKDFSLADSVFTNWMKTPSLDGDTRISFIGGVPGGFDQKAGLLFRIVFLTKSEGRVEFVPSGVKAFDNDGKATVIDVSATPLAVTIGPKQGDGKNQWIDIVGKDNDPPHDLSVAIGQDSSVVDGKKFLTISAKDDQSGIDHFEVAEGDRPAIRSGNMYVLRDQRETSPITVTAIDKAGNKARIILNPDIRDFRYYVVRIIIAFTIVALGAIGYRRYEFMKKRRHA